MKKSKFDIGDALIIFGVSVVCVGVWMMYPPAAVILSGLSLTLAGYLVSAPKTK